MRKWLLLIVSLIFSYLSIAQCGNEEIKDTLIKNDALVQKKYPFAQKIQWKTCQGIDIYYAIFTKKDTTYSVVYNHKNEWLATEKRIYQNIFDYDYDTEKVTDKKVPFASAKIFPTSLYPIMKKQRL